MSFVRSVLANVVICSPANPAHECHEQDVDSLSLIQSWTEVTSLSGQDPELPATVTIDTVASSSARGADALGSATRGQAVPDQRDMMELLGAPESQVHVATVGVRYEGHSAGAAQAYGTDYNGFNASPTLSEVNVSAFFARNGSLGDMFANDPDPSAVAGVGKNSLSDLPNLCRALFIYSSLLLLGIILFQYLRSWYPLVYCYNDLQAVSAAYTIEDRQSGILNEVPESLRASPDSTWFGASWRLWDRIDCTYDDLHDHSPDYKDLVEHIGLDALMFLHFLQFAMKLLLRIGIPMILVLCSVNAFCGSVAQKEDLLTRIGMNNLPEKSPWLWVHAIFVWYVVWTVQETLYHHQEKFFRAKLQWLRSMKKPRATTVMLQNIPNLGAVDDKVALTDVINKSMCQKNAVEKVTFVRPMFDPKQLITQPASTEKETEHAKSKAGKEPASTAFVTFTERQYAEMFLNIRLKPSDFEFITSTLPDATDLNWEAVSLEQTAFGCAVGGFSWQNFCCGICSFVDRVGSVSQGREHTQVAPFLRWAFGYALILLLFLAFAPLIALISSLTRLEYAETVFPKMHRLVINSPFLFQLWNAVFASLGLTLFLGFLPWMIMLIHRQFFPTVTETETQLGLQRTYYNFQVVFVVLVTALSGSIAATAETLFRSPLALLDILADRLPQSSHFYLSWYVLQWLTQTLGLLRYVNLWKYITAKPQARIIALALREADRVDDVTDRTAKKLAEPENRDSYGIGARSAEMTLLLTVALVFCSLLPIICFFGFITLGIARTIYGYLLVYSETRKSDSGGIFWCAQLEQVHGVVFLYIVLMIGVFAFRADDKCLLTFVILALFYNLYRYMLYKNSFRLNVLPLLDHKNRVDFGPPPELSKDMEESYVQAGVQAGFSLSFPVAETAESPSAAGPSAGEPSTVRLL